MDIKTKFDVLDSVYITEKEDDGEWYVSEMHTIQGINIVVINDKVKIYYAAHKTANNDSTVFNGLRGYNMFTYIEDAKDRCWSENEKLNINGGIT